MAYHVMPTHHFSAHSIRYVGSNGGGALSFLLLDPLNRSFAHLYRVYVNGFHYIGSFCVCRSSTITTLISWANFRFNISNGPRLLHNQFCFSPCHVVHDLHDAHLSLFFSLLVLRCNLLRIPQFVSSTSYSFPPLAAFGCHLSCSTPPIWLLADRSAVWAPVAPRRRE